MGLLLACAATLAAQPSTISGRVSNLLTGSPVRKAQLILNPGSRTVITDSDGHYTIAGVGTGLYKLSVERAGFLPVVYGAHGPNRPGKTLIVAPGEVKTNVNFTLEPPAVITGHLYDQDGEPLPSGVQVWRETYRNGRRELTLAAGANGDDEGEYRIYGLPAGRYYVASAQVPTGAGPEHLREVYPQTFYPGSEEISGAAALTLAPGGEARNIDFHLRKTAAVSVSIEIQGISVPDQNVSILMEGRDRNTNFRGNTNAGEFKIARVTPGSYSIDAISRVGDEQFIGHTDVDVGTLDAEGVRLTLVPALVISGTVRTDVDPSAFLLLLSSSAASAARVSARPSPDGKFTWGNLQAGTWTVSVDGLPAGMYLKNPREIEIKAEPQKPVEVMLSSDGASLEGKVVNPDSVEGATVLLIAEGVLKFAVTEFEGKFAFHSIPPGKYRLLAVEDMETQSWNDPLVLKQLDGKGVAIELTAHQHAVQNLVPVQ